MVAREPEFLTITRRGDVMGAVKPRPGTKTPVLAIHGAQPVRKDPMPSRLALGDAEVKMIEEVINFYRRQGVDPGHQGHFENLYTDAFVAMMGGGYADAVATGTAALWVALAALQLPEGAEVLVSPMTDPGTISAIIFNRLRPRLMDSKPGSYNIGVDQFVERVSPDTRAAVIVHSAGRACEMDKIMAAARERSILVVEDCSQAHGAKVMDRAVGTFGDLAAFSTMYRKTHMTGGSGGVVYSGDLETFHRALAYADRGKPRWRPDFDDRNPNSFLFPGLNLHTDEISCAIGLASLSRLADTIERRLAFVTDLAERLAKATATCRLYGYLPGDSLHLRGLSLAAYHNYPIIVDVERLTCSKTEFALAVQQEGIPLSPHSNYVVAEWPWVKPYLADLFDTQNARTVRDRSFTLFLNENYGDREAEDITAAICKVEQYNEAV